MRCSKCLKNICDEVARYPPIFLSHDYSILMCREQKSFLIQWTRMIVGPGICICFSNEIKSSLLFSAEKPCKKREDVFGLL